jgi:hypothetical protein
MVKHRDNLIRDLRKEIKKLSIANGNAKVKKVKLDWQEESL